MATTSVLKFSVQKNLTQILWQNICPENFDTKRTWIMKKETTLTALLGLSQHEAAMLLGVSRSQWSMYESGQRDLPLHAKELLAALLAHMQSYDAAAKSTTALQKITNDQLQRQMQENEYQQLLIGRKIARIAKKQEAQARLLHLSDFLNAHHAYKNANPQLRQVITARTTPEREAEFSVVLSKLQYQLEILVMEKQFLASKASTMR